MKVHIHVTGRAASEIGEGGVQNVNINLFINIKRSQGGTGNKRLKPVRALYRGIHYYEKKCRM